MCDRLLRPSKSSKTATFTDYHNDDNDNDDDDESRAHSIRNRQKQKQNIAPHPIPRGEIAGPSMAAAWRSANGIPYVI